MKLNDLQFHIRDGKLAKALRKYEGHGLKKANS